MTVFVDWPMIRIFGCLSSYVLRNEFGERGNYTLSQEIVEWKRFVRRNCLLISQYWNELEDAVIMRIQALFMKEKPSWNLVMYSILQVVAAFYASLQIRCTAHNPRTAEVTECKIIYQKDPTFSFAVYCCTQQVSWRSQRQSEKVKATSKNRFLVGSPKILA